jgi:hypothetical protein
VFGDLGARFVDALALAVPDAPPAELWWRLRCVVAIITYLLANSGTTLSLLDLDDVEGTAERLVAFLAPAIRSPLQSAGAIPEVARAMAGASV